MEQKVYVRFMSKSNIKWHGEIVKVHSKDHGVFYDIRVSPEYVQKEIPSKNITEFYTVISEKEAWELIPRREISHFDPC